MRVAIPLLALLVICVFVGLNSWMPRPAAPPNPHAPAAPAASPAGSPGASPAALPPLSADAEALFDPNLSDDDFKKKLQKVKASGAAPQTLLEAQFVRALRAKDLKTLAALAPEFDRVAPTLNVESSQVFSSKEDFGAMQNASKALAAHERKDIAGFEAGMKEAFWLDPGNAQIYGEWLGELRTEQRMADYRLPMDLPLKTAEGGTATLKQLAANKKGVLIDFWASWCGPCMALIPEYKSKAKNLEPQGVVVLGMNTENSPKIAASIKKEKGITTPWLVEPASMPYSKALNITGIPHMVLAAPDGKVLYSGHPMDPKLEKALADLSVAL